MKTKSELNARPMLGQMRRQTKALAAQFKPEHRFDDDAIVPTR